VTRLIANTTAWPTMTARPASSATPAATGSARDGGPVSAAGTRNAHTSPTAARTPSNHVSTCITAHLPPRLRTGRRPPARWSSVVRAARGCQTRHRDRPDPQRHPTLAALPGGGAGRGGGLPRARRAPSRRGAGDPARAGGGRAAPRRALGDAPGPAHRAAAAAVASLACPHVARRPV